MFYNFRWDEGALEAYILCIQEERAEVPAEGQPLGVVTSDVTTADVPEEPTKPPEEPPKPKTVRIRKPRSMASSSQQVVVTEINDAFWAKLLQTQRSAEHATRLQRLSEFSLI